VGTVPPFSELIAATASSAIHLEMRDAYTPDDQRFVDWMAGKPLPCPANPTWSELVRAHKARGVRFRRARVVSEPLTNYIRFEHAITSEVNVSAGEEVRWLPRRRASDLCLPGNDLWLFDERLVRFSYFSGSRRPVSMSRPPRLLPLPILPSGRWTPLAYATQGSAHHMSPNVHSAASSRLVTYSNLQLNFFQWPWIANVTHE